MKYDSIPASISYSDTNEKPGSLIANTYFSGYNLIAVQRFYRIECMRILFEQNADFALDGGWFVYGISFNLFKCFG